MLGLKLNHVSKRGPWWFSTMASAATLEYKMQFWKRLPCCFRVKCLWNMTNCVRYNSRRQSQLITIATGPTGMAHVIRHQRSIWQSSYLLGVLTNLPHTASWGMTLFTFCFRPPVSHNESATHRGSDNSFTGVYWEIKRTVIPDKWGDFLQCSTGSTDVTHMSSDSAGKFD